MKIEEFSKIYKVRMVEESDLPAVLALYRSNPLYFEHYPPSPSLDSVREDMERLPSDKSAVDKFYLGFWAGQELVAVLDFVLAYPNDKTIFIGLFMVHQAYQGRGVGGQILTDVLMHFSKRFQKVRLAHVKTNPQASRFWQKQGFERVAEKTIDSIQICIVEKGLL